MLGKTLKTHPTLSDNSIWIAVSRISIIVISISGLILSHKVAGPLFKLHLHMEDVTNGKTTGPVSFIKGDYFPEIAKAYNEQLEKISKK